MRYPVQTKEDGFRINLSNAELHYLTASVRIRAALRITIESGESCGKRRGNSVISTKYHSHLNNVISKCGLRIEFEWNQV